MCVKICAAGFICYWNNVNTMTHIRVSDRIWDKLYSLKRKARKITGRTVSYSDILEDALFGNGVITGKKSKFSGEKKMSYQDRIDALNRLIDEELEREREDEPYEDEDDYEDEEDFEDED